MASLTGLLTVSCRFGPSTATEKLGGRQKKRDKGLKVLRRNDELRALGRGEPGI